MKRMTVLDAIFWLVIFNSVYLGALTLLILTRTAPCGGA
jgi:hypothetical protein